MESLHAFETLKKGYVTSTSVQLFTVIKTTKLSLYHSEKEKKEIGSYKSLVVAEHFSPFFS